MSTDELNTQERVPSQMVDGQAQLPLSEGVDLAAGLAVRSAIRAGQAEGGVTGLADWWQNLIGSLS
jgi:hypothetical protein